ncbi:MAG: S-layer homology domain-containing protein [Nodosilinea sp.]
MVPATSYIQSRGLKALFTRSSQKQRPLTVPPPVLPNPLPPQQAWPDLPQVKAQPSFTDLDTKHWAWPILADLSQRNLITGFPDGTFRPAAPITRAEFAAQLAQLFNLPTKPQAEVTVYTDMPTTHWAYGSVQQSMQMGFLSGYPDGTFLPEQTVSRIHVIAALASGLTLKSSRSALMALKPYSDQSQVPPWATSSLIAVLDAGLVVNYPNPKQLAPARPAERAEVAVMLHRALVYTGTLDDVPSPYVVGASGLTVP